MSDLGDLEEIEALTKRSVDLHSQSHYKSARARSKVIRAAMRTSRNAISSRKKGRSQKAITLPTINSLRDP